MHEQDQAEVVKYLDSLGKSYLVEWLGAAEEKYRSFDTRLSSSAGLLREMIENGSLLVTTDVDTSQLAVLRVAFMRNPDAQKAVPYIGVDPRLVVALDHGHFPGATQEDIERTINYAKTEIGLQAYEILNYFESQSKQAKAAGWTVCNVEEWSKLQGA